MLSLSFVVILETLVFPNESDDAVNLLIIQRVYFVVVNWLHDAAVVYESGMEEKGDTHSNGNEGGTIGVDVAE